MNSPDVDVYDLSKDPRAGLHRICMCISPVAAESRVRLPVCRSLHSAPFLRMVSRPSSGLGTDGITRSLENLVAKARALTEEGMTVYTLTSSYGYPPTTLTGSVERDIVLIPPMIGVKVPRYLDHRSSNWVERS